MPNFCLFTFISLWMPLAVFVISLVFSALISILYHEQQGANAPARLDRRASQPPFWRIFQLDLAVRPPSPRSTPPENTTKWVFQSKNPARVGRKTLRKLTQLISRSHPRHLVGKRTAKKRHHHRHHKRQPGKQQFPIQVVTG